MQVSRAPQRDEYRERRVGVLRLDLREPAKELGVVPEAAEPDHRPRRERETERERRSTDGGGPPARRREPHEERPEEDLQHDRTPEGGGHGDDPVAIPPRERDEQREHRPDGAVLDVLQRRGYRSATG